MKNTHASQKLLPLHNVSLQLLWIIRLVPSTANTPAWVLTTICSSPKGQRPNIGTQMDRAAMRHTVDLQVACSCTAPAHQPCHEVICWWAHCDNEGGQSPSLLRPCPISHVAEKCEQPIEEPWPRSTTTFFDLTSTLDYDFNPFIFISSLKAAALTFRSHASNLSFSFIYWKLELALFEWLFQDDFVEVPQELWPLSTNRCNDVHPQKALNLLVFFGSVGPWLLDTNQKSKTCTDRFLHQGQKSTMQSHTY